MQIEISDAQIEKIISRTIKARVDVWFSDAKSKYIIKEMVDNYVSSKLGTDEYRQLIQEEAIKCANKICTKDVVNKVCERVSCDIAEAFAEKYAD